MTTKLTLAHHVRRKGLPKDEQTKNCKYLRVQDNYFMPSAALIHLVREIEGVFSSLSCVKVLVLVTVMEPPHWRPVPNLANQGQPSLNCTFATQALYSPICFAEICRDELDLQSLVWDLSFDSVQQ